MGVIVLLLDKTHGALAIKETECPLSIRRSLANLTETMHNIFTCRKFKTGFLMLKHVCIKHQPPSNHGLRSCLWLTDQTVWPLYIQWLFPPQIHPYDEIWPISNFLCCEGLLGSSPGFILWQVQLRHVRAAPIAESPGRPRDDWHVCCGFLYKDATRGSWHRY